MAHNKPTTYHLQPTTCTHRRNGRLPRRRNCDPLHNHTTDHRHHYLHRHPTHWSLRFAESNCQSKGGSLRSTSSARPSLRRRRPVHSVPPNALQMSDDGCFSLPPSHFPLPRPPACPPGGSPPRRRGGGGTVSPSTSSNENGMCHSTAPTTQQMTLSRSPSPVTSEPTMRPSQSDSEPSGQIGRA